MNEFLALIVFVLPGFIAFNLLSLFGLYPTFKHKNNEIIVLSAIMWIPINMIVLGVYSLVVILLNTHYSLDIPYIRDMDSLITLSNDFIFILYYVTFSALVAYFLAKLASDKMYYNLLSHINKIRNKNGKASLSRNPTVWENSFSNDDFQIVRVSMSNKTYIGEIKTISGNVENGKDFILQFEDHWKKIMEKYEIEVVEVYIDTETKIVIETFHRGQCINAQDLYEKKYLNVDK
ncbi:MAG TPA: DUF6338 family protein [Virgibacillus sp.]|nr:DUF6338 family protein [Virgibacillus sp.]HLR69439.1 DUF6338 family protein [Virgibacillus sp.]